MFGQVLICVLMGSSGIRYSSLGVGVGGGVALLGGDWGQDLPPAFTDMCHLWWRRLKPIWGVLLSASQESNPEGEREEGEADSSARQSWSAVWSEVARRSRHQGKVHREHQGDGGQVNSAFSCVCPFGPHFEYMSSFGKLSIWKKPLLKSGFFFSTLLFLFFLFLFLFFSHLLFLWEQEVRQWSSQAGSMLSSSMQRR